MADETLAFEKLKWELTQQAETAIKAHRNEFNARLNLLLVQNQALKDRLDALEGRPNLAELLTRRMKPAKVKG